VLSNFAELFDGTGRRLYLTQKERRAFVDTARRAPPDIHSFCTVMHDTGCRISEALEVSPERIDLAGGCIIFRTLKKRDKIVYRAVPIPQDTLDQLDLVHNLRAGDGAGLRNTPSPSGRGPG